MGSNRAATDVQRKAEALQIAAEHGAAEASRRTGIPASTIRAWLTRAKKGSAETVEPTTAARSEPERRSDGIDPGRGARNSWRVAENATRKALEYIEQGKTLDAQRMMVTAGIAADKTGTLQEAAGRARERELRIERQTAENVVAVLCTFFEAAAIPFGDYSASRRLVAALLRQCEPGSGVQVLSAPGPEAEAARCEVRAHFERLLEPEFRDRAARQRPQLPPAPSLDDVEIVDGEVVE